MFRYVIFPRTIELDKDMVDRMVENLSFRFSLKLVVVKIVDEKFNLLNMISDKSNGWCERR